jgi:hypothetical protein
VKFKLDENLPASSAAILAGAGHDVDTVGQEGLSGAPDPEVVAAAADEKSGGPSGHLKMPRVERTRTPWDKLQPGRGCIRVPADEVVSGHRRDMRIPGFPGDAANQQVARVAEIARLVVGLGLRHSVRLGLACHETLLDHASFSDRARTDLRNVPGRARRHELCLGGSMTSRQAATVAMSSRRPRRQ